MKQYFQSFFKLSLEIKIFIYVDEFGIMKIVFFSYKMNDTKAFGDNLVIA